MSEANQSDGETSTARSGSARPSRVGSILLLALIALVALQSARLVWALITPAGPLGKTATNSSRTAVLAGDFDPFFRLATSAASTSVTSLPLKLYGTRRDGATGQGSAIIATPDGVQSSFAIGEAIMPGVTLAAVANDEVTIDRGGAKEKLYLDQSIPAPVVQPSSVNNRTSDQTSTAPQVTPLESTAPPLVRPDQAPPPPPTTMEQR